MAAGMVASTGNTRLLAEQERKAKEQAAAEEAARQAEIAKQKAAYDITHGMAQEGYAASMNAAARQYQEDPATAALRRVALGQAPSVAGNQYQANLAQMQRQALGVAAGARGADRAGARLQALQGFSAGAGQQAAQMAALEGQERQQAAGMVGQMGLQGFGATTQALASGLGAAQGFGGLELGAGQGDVQVSQFQQQLEEMRRQRAQQWKLAIAQGLGGAAMTYFTGGMNRTAPAA